ncbi:carboxypeptidase-like regulatory domain-containing protein [Luteitalea sp.]|uniref:carboxypeptidase-like regulatory domain-containing protein n=1 Tax=Luteitalea sp. TaxID=2004800 RepID=UPI0025C4842A|nr:carboxypeptidase-like regulatory domain-containing protein [Luteitalea sp.]
MTLRRTRLSWAMASVLAGAVLVGARVFAQGHAGVVLRTPPPPTQRPDGTATVRGRVVDGSTGRPLRDVTIGATWRASEGEGVARFSARTDGLGVFTFERLPEGAYSVHAYRRGFIDDPAARQAQRDVMLRGGGTIDLGDVRLLRGGVVTGRVVDDHGEPVVGARVTPLGRLPGDALLTPLGAITVTDDRGVYRAHGLMPATYTVRVVPPGPSGRGPVRLQGSEPELLSAFATSAFDVSVAEFVDVRAGEEAILDLRLGTGRLSRVVGQVVMQGEAATSTQPSVSLRPIDPAAQFSIASARMQPDGVFEFLDVSPGRYRVVAEELRVMTSLGPNRRRAGWAELNVGGEPLVEVMVPVGFGAAVRGRLEIEHGDETALVGRSLEVVTSPVASKHVLHSGSMASSTIKDMAFTLTDVLAHQQLRVQGLPAGWWLKSVLVDGQDVYDGHDFPLSGVMDGVVLLVSARPSGVRGRVEAGGSDLRGASVLVLPGDSLHVSRRHQSEGRVASVSMDGRFAAEALRPGRYSVLALSPRGLSAYDQLDHDARRAVIATHGRVVDVVEGRLATVVLRMVER